MKGQIETVEDEFWTERLPFFTAQFPTYYRKPQQVHGRFHTSEEKYSASAHEIIPISEKHGKRTFAMMHPYVLEPKLTITVGLGAKPKHYADQEDAIGKTIGQPKHEGFQKLKLAMPKRGTTPPIKRLSSGRNFFRQPISQEPLRLTDTNMQRALAGV